MNPVAVQGPTVYLADANFLLRLIDVPNAHYPIAHRVARLLRSRGDQIVTVAQSYYEFFVVATRPAAARGGLGLNIADAQRVMDHFKKIFPLLPETPLFDQWARLVTIYNTQGVSAHDARIVAAMLEGGVQNLLTFNSKDFRRYEAGENIIVDDPTNII